MVLGDFIEQRYPVFDPSSIVSNRITSATLVLKKKPSSRPISNQGIRVVYFFDDQGRLSNWLQITTSAAGKMDTLRTTYLYVAHQLQAISTSAGKYQKTVLFDRKNDSLTLETTRVKRGNLDWQEISKEQVASRTHQGGKIIFTKTSRGGVGEKPYQTIITERDQNGLLLRESRYGNRIQSIERWSYENGRLNSLHLQEFMPFKERRVTFPRGNQQHDAGEWCEGQKCVSWSFVEYPNSLPKAWLFFDAQTQDLEIWEFEYTYY